MRRPTRAALCIALVIAQPPESVLRKRVAAEYVYVYENGGGQRTNGPPDKWPGQCKAPWLMTPELAVCCCGRCASSVMSHVRGSAASTSRTRPPCSTGAARIRWSRAVACVVLEPPCYTAAPLTKEAKSSTIAHVAIAAGRTHALGLVAAARSVVDASAEPKNLRLYLATDLVEGSRARSVLEQSLKCALKDINMNSL